jgi:hypothetical protein
LFSLSPVIVPFIEVILVGSTSLAIFKTPTVAPKVSAGVRIWLDEFKCYTSNVPVALNPPTARLSKFSPNNLPVVVLLVSLIESNKSLTFSS